MNYIPGFSNHLQAAVPRYARGGRARFDEPMMYDVDQYLPPVDQYLPPIEQYIPPVEPPMAQEVAAPAAAPAAAPVAGGLSYEDREARRIAANTAPQGTYISAPMDNLGKGTGYDIAGQGSNLFSYRGGPIRVTDRKGNVLFSGEGPEAAAEAVRFAQNLSDTKGKSASWDIQQGERTINPDGSVGATRWVSGPTDYKEGKGLVGDIIGTALPLAVMAVPGVGQLGLALKAATAAAAGGMGAAFRDADPLKAAITAGLSAAGGDVIGKALEGGGALGTNLAPRLATSIGTGVGATAGGLATGQSLQDALLSGAASGAASYVSPDVIKAIGGGAPTSTSTGGAPNANVGNFDGISVVGGRTISPGFTLGGTQNKIQKALDQGVEEPFDGITAIGSKFGNLPGVNVDSSLLGAPTEGRSPLDKLTDTADPNEILVKGTPSVQPIPAPVPVTGALNTNPVVNGVDTVTGEIVANAPTVEQTTGGLTLGQTDPSVGKRLADMENYKEPIVVTGSKIEPIPVSTDLGLGAGSVTDTLPPLDLKPDPALTDDKKLGLEEYLRIASLISGLVGGGGGSGQTGTYGGTGTGRLNPIFSAKLPSAGGLGAIGANRTARPMGDVDWLTYGTRPELNFFDYASQANPAPITTPIPNEPRGPSMYVPDTTRFAKGGRAEFAVNGPGTGRSDDIPAVLSDGEYVIDAETVALLGDGSSKAGAKKLDELRVKVRKHKGKKLAKGRFSANAKKPEAYLSGGRI